MLSNQAKELIPEVALFIRAPGNSRPLTLCDSTIITRRDFQPLIGEDMLSVLMPDENGKLEIELKNRVFIVRSQKIRTCQIDNDFKSNGFVKTIWPNQSVFIRLGEIELEFYVMKCNYS